MGAADASAQASATAKATAQAIADAVAKATNNNAKVHLHMHCLLTGMAITWSVAQNLLMASGDVS